MPSFLTNWLRNTSSRLLQHLALVGVLLLTGEALCQAGNATAPQVAGSSARLVSAVPMAFEENDGQLAPELSYLGRARSYSVAIERDRLEFFMPSPGANSTIDVRFAGSRGGSPVSLSGVAYRSNFFIGSDPSRWHEGVANFSRVGIRSIYPGIDTEFYDKEGALEHDFILAPGADANSIRLDLRSDQQVTLTASGDAVIPATGGELRFRKPVAYQFDAEGKRVAVDASYRLKKNSLQFALGSYDRSRTLVIDPVIVFATYLAGNSASNGSTPAQLTADANGNLYIAGTTTSAAGDFPAAGHCTNVTSSATTCAASTAGTTKNIFVAALVANQLGSSISWITLLGGANNSIATSVVANSSKVYVAGTTGSSNFPGVKTTGMTPSSQTVLPTATSVSGIVASLNTTDGTLPSASTTPTSQYIVTDTSGSEDDKTTITGLALDGSGNVYVSGYGLGNSFTKPVSATSPINPFTLLNSLGTATAPVIPAATATSTNHNAFVIELDPTLQPANAKLVTYLQSTTTGDYRATAIQVDGTGQIYVAGTVGAGSSLQFPSAKSFASATPFYTAANDFDPNGCLTTSPATRVFLAQIQPASGNSVLGFSLFTCGANTAADSETALGLALGASGAYLVGSTTAPDLYAAGVDYSLPSFANGTNQMQATFTGGLQPAFAGTIDGYVIKVPLAGSPLVAAAPSAFTYLGGSLQAGGVTSASSQVNAAAIDDTNHLLQLAGQTNASRATMPTTAGASGLPPGVQDPSGDNSRAFLYSLDDSGPETTNPFLTTAKSISYLGNTATNSAALSVLPDTAGAGAYVLGFDTVTGTGQGFTSSDAIGVAANGTKPNSYVADIQGTGVSSTLAGLAFTADANSPTIDGNACSDAPGSTDPCVIAYNSASDTSTVLYTWDLKVNGPAAAADNVVLNFPEQDAFTSSASPAYTINLDGTAIAKCASKQNNNGTTCVIPSVDAGTHHVTLQAVTGPNAQSMVTTTFAFDGNAADAQGEYADAPQPNVTIAKPVSITLSYTQTSGAINASSDNTGTGGTTVVYTATVTNTSPNDSPKTTLSITALPPATQFKVTSITAVVGATNVIASCDATTGTGCATFVDVPSGSALVYTITGVYLGPGFGTTTPGPYTLPFNASATALPFTTNNKTQTAPTLTTTVNGYANLTVSVVQPPYPGAGYTNAATAFNLGAGPLTYTVTVNNAGPNAVNTGAALNFANVLPNGFTVASATAVVTGGAAATCSAAGTSCSITALPSTGKIVYTITGSFPDSATGAGAVPASVPSAVVTDTATLPALPAGTFDPNSLSNAQNVTVQRLVHLKLTLTVTSTPTATGASYLTQPGFNLSTATPVTYTYTINNAGPDYAINVGLTSLDAPPTGYTPPTGSIAVTPPTVTGLTCTGTPASNTYSTCNVANIAPATSPTLAYTVLYPDLPPNPVNFANMVPVSAVPGNASSATWSYSISTPAAYPNAVDNTPTLGDNAANTAATIYRTTHLKLTVATPTATATGPSYPTQPGYNLSSTPLNYTYSIENDGPNIAVYVPLTNAFAQLSPPVGFTPPTGSVVVTPPTSGNLNCATGATNLYSSNCNVAAVPPNTPTTPLQLIFPVTYPDLAPPAGTYPAPESVSAVPTDQKAATYNYTTTTPPTYTNSVDSNPAATAGGSNTFTAPASIYRTIHLKFTLMNTGPTVSGPAYSLPAPNNANNGYNLGSAVQYSYQIQNSGPNIALNVPLSNTLAPTNPGAYAAPAGSFLVMTPTSGSVVCSLAGNNTTSSCGVEAISPAGDNLAFTITYPDLPPTAYVFPTQDLSAVPSSLTNATYKYSTITPAAYANAIDSNPTATAGGDNTSATSVNLFRTSAMTLTTPAVTGSGTPCAPSSPTPCFYMANSGGPTNTGMFDTATYTVQVNNSGPNLATNSVLTIPLPANFLVTPNTSVAFNGIATTGVANQLVCTYQSTPNAIVCQGYVPSGNPQVSTVTVTSKFSTATVPVGDSFTTTASSPGSASVAATTVSTYTPVNLPTVAIDRASHLVAVKLVGPAPTNASPNGFAVNGVLAVNLDEKVAADANGKNDTVQITQQIGNAGLNDATGVVITDTLPPYFILTQLPNPSIATCTVTGPTTNDAAGHPMTGAAPATLTCNLQNAVPRGTATPGSGTTHGTVSGAFAQVVYYGKFEDNGLQPDAVPMTAGSTTVQFVTLSAASVDLVNLGAASDSTSATVAPIPVMRAAHLHFTLTQYVQPGDAPLNPVGGPTPGVAISPGIAEAQLGANGGEVINPVRYQVKVTNDGPNFATSPVVTTTLPPNTGGAPTTFINVNHGIEPALQGFPVVPSGCTSAQSCQDAGLIVTGASTLYNVDGNFDLNTLTLADDKGDFGQRLFASVITDSTVIDSNAAATAAGDQQTSLPINVVNTPVGTNFTLTPSSANLNLKLGTVQLAGVTSLVASGSGLPQLPMGPSPNPPDKGATKALYHFGTGGLYYAVGTTASVPTGSQNPTKLCLTSIPDVFDKPERVLLWALSNAPPGTTFNTVPNYTNTATAGDITVSVLPQSGGSYTVPTAITSYPPAVQAQPGQVCGVLNGLPDAANPTTLAVLEPVNYAPYIRTTVVPTPTSQPGKGVTASAAVVDLTISAKNNYDYNDQDPCYTGDGTTRSTCDDNVQLTTFLFGGQNLIGDSQQQHSYFYGQIPNQSMPQFNLPAGLPQIYVLLTDQVGAQHYQNIGTSSTDPQGCDPGTLSAAYTPTAPFCTDKPPLSSSGVTVPPNQAPLTDNPSAQVAVVTGSVGFGGSSGLIAITAQPEAVAHVTAGQTSGFVWNALTENPAVQGTGGNPPPVFTLACVSADGTNLAAVGIQCTLPQTYTYSTGSGNTLAITQPPAIYVVTSSNTAVGALHEAPLSRDMRIVAAIVFPVGAIPLILLLRRRKALRLSGWLAVIFLASLVGLGVGCGSSNFNNMGGTTTTATPAGTYEFMVTATSGSTQINSPKFAVVVSPVQ